MFNNNYDKGYGLYQMDNQCCQTVSKQNCPEDPIYEMPIVNCVQKDYVHEIVHD